MVAAEPSGDRLAAALVEVLKRRRKLAVRGLAGPALRAVGVEAVARSEDATAMGLVEVIGSLPRIAAVARRLRRDLVDRPPTAVLTVDSPEFSLRFGAFARGQGHPVVHWVAPQVWAWRAGRVRGLGRAADTVLCLFPFEPALLSGHVPAVFTGHPAVCVTPGVPLRPGEPTFALVPGSRSSEIRRHWPVLREVARRLRQRHPRAGFVVARAPGVARRDLGGLDATLVDGIEGVAAADAAVVASGTATLQLAALGVPMVVVYQVHPLTAVVARRLLRVPHVALPNVLAGETRVPEFLQHLDPLAIAAAVDGVRGQVQVPRALIDGLEGDRAVLRAADEVDRWLDQPSR